MSRSSKTIALTLAAGGALFTMQAMAHGYANVAEGACGGTHEGAGKHDHEGGCGMAKMDTDKDGRISRAEFAAAHEGKDEKFAAHDANGDGFITQAEMDAHHAAKAGAAGDAKQGEGKCGAEGKCGEGKCGGM